MKTYAINEIFYSISGEALNCGKPTVFVRFFGCNCRCVYCDSMYANEGTDFKKYTQREIIDKIKEVSKIKQPHIILTGGEPLLQCDCNLFMDLVANFGTDIEFETNGATPIPIWAKPAILTVDYKSLYSGANGDMIVQPFTCLKDSTDSIKCVIADRQDYDNFVDFINRHPNLRNVTKFLSPVFGVIEPHTIVEWMLEDGLDTTWRMQIQMHKVIWDPNRRGV